MYEFICKTKTITSTDSIKKDRDDGYCHKYTITTSPYDLINYQHPNFMHYLNRTTGVF